MKKKIQHLSITSVDVEGRHAREPFTNHKAYLKRMAELAQQGGLIVEITDTYIRRFRDPEHLAKEKASAKSDPVEVLHVVLSKMLEKARGQTHAELSYCLRMVDKLRQAKR